MCVCCGPACSGIFHLCPQSRQCVCVGQTQALSSLLTLRMNVFVHLPQIHHPDAHEHPVCAAGGFCCCSHCPFKCPAVLLLHPQLANALCPFVGRGSPSSDVALNVSFHWSNVSLVFSAQKECPTIILNMHSVKYRFLERDRHLITPKSPPRERSL